MATFVQWQKCHTCPDGAEHAIVLSPPQQAGVGAQNWLAITNYHCQFFCPHSALLQPGNLKPIPMNYFLKNEHIELIHAQMEHDKQDKILLKSVSELTNIQMHKSSISMSKLTCHSESYLSNHYGVEAPPPDCVRQPKIAHLSWP